MSVACETLSVAVCGNLAERRVITESELEGPSSSQRVLDPDASTPIQRSMPIPPVLESQQKTCEDLTNRLVEAGGTIVGLAAELKQKDCEVTALKERLQGSEQKLQREEARNAWLNKFTGTLTSELQTLRTEGTKVKLTGKVPDRDWLHEAKQRWRAVKCPNCRIPFHHDMMRKFYMERIAPLEHATTYFGDPVQLRRSRLILPFLFDCLDRYITMFEGEMPLEHRKEMLFVFFKEVDTKFPDLVLDAEDRYPGPYDLRAELKHLLSFYLRREIADREEIADYTQQVGSHFMRRTWPPECWNSRVIERNLAVVHGISFHDLG
ncbi:hypothetical protein R1flu_023437 [Riccia fluitans]|uniref:Uncharacterized protein n=1 Tax=Riccia fluitans TaxID=41844 RepID=A0ABD1XS20_9MARC